MAQSSKKTLRNSVLLLLLLLGGSGTYFLYNSNSTDSTEQSIESDAPIAVAVSHTQESDQLTSEDNNTTDISIEESEATTLVEDTDIFEDQLIESQDNKIAQVAETESMEEGAVKQLEEDNSTKSRGLVEVKSAEEQTLVAKIDTDKAASVVEKVVILPTEDPFNLIIETEAEESNVLDKYDYGLYINTTNRTNGRLVDGKVQVYDNVRSKKINTVTTHSLAGVNDPNNRTQSVRIISNVFGYRPQEVVFQLNEPEKFNDSDTSSVNSLGDNLIRVDMSLERLRAGDIAVMWQVYFYRDAAIMQPRSKPELDDLYTMMKENPNMKIKLHGHTNGNSHGKIIHLGKDDNNDLFSLNSDKHVETAGSAQKLSLYRAETIQHYLYKRGIDMSRIEIKGWGGKKMMHDKHSNQAKLNVRVEVEIVEA